MSMMAACGLICSDCPALQATRANDAEAIARVAAEWSAAFHVDVKPEHVWCEGCLGEHKRRCFHAGECEVRACVVGRGLANCAACPDWGCATSTAFFATCPPARANLEALRAR